MLKVLTISEIFSEFLFEIEKFRKNKSFGKLQTIKLSPKHVFQKNGLIYDRKFPQNDPNVGKSEKFQVFFNIFRPLPVQFLSYFLAKNGLKKQ